MRLLLLALSWGLLGVGGLSAAEVVSMDRLSWQEHQAAVSCI